MAGRMLLSNSVIQPCRTPTKQQLSQYWLLDRLPVICLSSHHPPRLSTIGQCHPTLTFCKRECRSFSVPAHLLLSTVYISPTAILQCMPRVVIFFQMSPIFHCIFSSQTSATDLQEVAMMKYAPCDEGFELSDSWRKSSLTLKYKPTRPNTVYAAHLS